MIAQEKAKKLVDMFGGNKEYARICVEEIIKSWDKNKSNRFHDEIIFYWQTVLTEIEKL